MNNMAEAKLDDSIKELKNHISDTYKELEENVIEQEKQIKENGEATEKVGTKIDELDKKLKEQRQEYKDKLEKFETKAGRLDLPGGKSFKTLGQQFVESDSYKSYDMNGKSKRYEIAQINTKDESGLDGTSLGDTPGYLYSPERVDEWFRAPEREERVRDLIPVLQTSVGAIEFVKETGFGEEPEGDIDGDTKGAAATVAEKDEKPEAKIEFSIESETVKTIAHWLPATRQIIDDATQLRNYIDQRLIYGLKLEEDEQILYGDGTGSNLQGIMTDSDVQEYDWSGGETGDTKIDAIRRAMTKALVAEYPVSGTVIHPNDWEDIELLKGNDGHYLWVTVMQGGQQMLWRAPVVVTTAINEGDFLTGAFEMGTALWDRQDAAIRVSDSHEEYFTKNMWAILAEERIAQTIYRPEAFVVGDFDNEPA